MESGFGKSCGFYPAGDESIWKGMLVVIWCRFTFIFEQLEDELRRKLGLEQKSGGCHTTSGEHVEDLTYTGMQRTYGLKNS